MKTRDLKSLSETIASVVDPIDKERAQMLQEGFLNSLTEKARQIASKEMEDENEEEDEMEDEGEEEEEKPSNKKKSKMMNEEVELAEKAAPGYEDWASDPKVKASFKKQYGKRWQEVMYGHSWNLAKQEKKVGLDEDMGLEEGVKRMRRLRRAHASGKASRETTAAYDKELAKVSASRLRRGGAPKQTVRGFFTDKPTTSAADKAYAKFSKDAMTKARAKGKKIYEEEQLDEAVSAKRMRIIRKYVKGNKRVPERLKDYMERSFKKKRFKDKQLSDGRGAVGALETRMRRKSAALRARGIEPKGVAPGYLEEDMQLDEGKYKKLMRVKGAAYKAELAGNDEKRTRLKRAAAELTDKVAAGMARRGGASPEAVRGGGSGIGKRGKYTKKAGKLANMRDRAIAAFHGKSRKWSLIGDLEDKSRKRERQQAQAKFNMDARHGDWGHKISPEIKAAGMRAYYNYEKKYGRLKGK